MMQCPNLACKRDLFEVRVVHKKAIKGLLMLPVELTYAHCGRKIKAWVTNQNLKDIKSRLEDLLKQAREMTEELKELKERTKRRGFFGSLRERIKKTVAHIRRNILVDTILGITITVVVWWLWDLVRG